MIAQLRGKVVSVGEKSAVIDIGGVGYGVHVPDNVLTGLKIGEEAEFITYHHVKENINELFGFNDASSKNLFELLIGVSGVGPKSALAIVSLGPEDKVRQAITSDNSKYLSGASGIGKRTAQRICSELKDKLGSFDTITGASPVSDDALEALLSLGYSQQQAIGALNQVDRALSSEEQVKLALKGLS